MLTFSGKELLAIAKTTASEDRFNLAHIQITPNEIVTTNGHYLTVISGLDGFDVEAPSYVLASRLLDLRATDTCFITPTGIQAVSKRGNETMIAYTNDVFEYPDIDQVVPALPTDEDSGAAFAGFGIDVLGGYFSVVKAFGVNAVKFNSPKDKLCPSVVQAKREPSGDEQLVNIYGVIMPLRLDCDYPDYRETLNLRVRKKRSAA